MHLTTTHQMKRAVYIFILLAVGLTSCKPRHLIPVDDMADIYFDFYLADRYLEATDKHELGDSVKIYIPIIEDHGYKFEDYQATIGYYLHKPEVLTKIFDKTEKKLVAHKERLSALIAKEENFHKKWKLLDSLEIYGDTSVTGNGYYRALRLLFFKADTPKVTSPVIDSAILRHIYSPYFLYDSLPALYDEVKFIELPLSSADTLRARTKRVKPQFEKLEPVKEEELEEARSEQRINKFHKAKFDDKKENFR